jgi:hypothetical protein
MQSHMHFLRPEGREVHLHVRLDGLLEAIERNV